MRHETRSSAARKRHASPGPLPCPVSERRNWEGFHGLWAAAIVETLNRDILAEEYFADMEIDVAALEEPQSISGAAASGAPPGLLPWTPHPPRLVMPTVFPDDIEVQVFTTTTGASLVAAIELVRPGNKDRPEARRAF